MARGSAVWGIDIGQCALKALRCTPHPEDAKRVVVDAFDYIEYPKILSQPEADAVELVGNALKEFLSRNSVRGDRVAISVSGQAGLSRFIKLPPVESKKIPDIVKYEAKQQIPFALEDVVWDYQQMAGGSEEDGFALETEVGLFAMKREQVFRALKPYTAAGIEVDVIQLAPLALYNFVTFDQMPNLPPADEFDPDNPPESMVVISLGTDTTDLVITNGYRVWQRSIPLGGNHFTKALTKELKLTFAAAEHLKRNAATAENPKLLFQAMRPVFNDMLTELQRSIGYFQNVHRNAKIGKAIGLGNAMKLPGLQRYLQQNLGMDVVRLDSFRGVDGPAIVDTPAFKDNLLALAVPYGLCVQGMADARIRTNLIPRELLKDRMIRAKKPWAVAAASLLMLGTTLSYASYWRAYASVEPSKFQAAKSQATTIASTATTYNSDFEAAKGEFNKISRVAVTFGRNAEGRRLWLDVLRGINAAIPQPEGDPKKTKPEEEEKRTGVYIEQLETKYIDDVKTWYDAVVIAKPRWGNAPVDPNVVDPNATATTADSSAIATTTPAVDSAADTTTPPADATAAPVDGTAPVDPNAVPADPNALPADPNAVPADPNAVPAAAPPPPVEAPTGPGFIIQLSGYHYHNSTDNPDNMGQTYVLNSLIKNLETVQVDVPDPETGAMTKMTLKEMGVKFPVVLPNAEVDWKHEVPEFDAAQLAAMAATPSFAAQPISREGVPAPVQDGSKMINLPKHEFIVQFIWQSPKRAEDAAKLANADGATSDATATTDVADATGDTTVTPPVAPVSPDTATSTEPSGDAATETTDETGNTDVTENTAEPPAEPSTSPQADDGASQPVPAENPSTPTPPAEAPADETTGASQPEA
jgi:type IV pilus assembly protein PilM